MTLVICQGGAIGNIATQTTDNAKDIQFVYFTAAKTGTTMYTGGTALGTVAAASFTGAASPYTATLAGASIPVNTGTTPIVYYIYVRLADSISTTCSRFRRNYSNSTTAIKSL